MRSTLDTTGKRPSPHCSRWIGPWTRPTVGSEGLAESALHTRRPGLLRRRSARAALPRVRCTLDTTGSTSRCLNKHGRRCATYWTRPTVGLKGVAERAQHTRHDRQPESPPAALPGALCTAHQHIGHDRHSAHTAWPTMRITPDTTGKRPNPHGRRCIGPWTRPTIGSVGLAGGALHTGHDRRHWPSPQQVWPTVRRILDMTDSRAGRLCRACTAH